MVGLSAPTSAQGKLFASIEQMRPGGDFTMGGPEPAKPLHQLAIPTNSLSGLVPTFTIPT